MKFIFGRDLCLDENTSQAASVEFVPVGGKLWAQQTAKICRKAPKGFFDNLKPCRDISCRAAFRYRMASRARAFWVLYSWA